MGGNANASRSACEAQGRAARINISVSRSQSNQSTRSHGLQSRKTLAPWSHETSESFRGLRVRRIPHFSEIFLKTVLLQLVAAHFLKEFSSPRGVARILAVAATDPRPHNRSIPHNESSDERSSERHGADFEKQMVPAPAMRLHRRTRLRALSHRSQHLSDHRTA
jgi:hypothetical protein